MYKVRFFVYKYVDVGVYMCERCVVVCVENKLGRYKIRINVFVFFFLEKRNRS